MPSFTHFAYNARKDAIICLGPTNREGARQGSASDPQIGAPELQLQDHMLQCHSSAIIYPPPRKFNGAFRRARMGFVGNTPTHFDGLAHSTVRLSGMIWALRACGNRTISPGTLECIVMFWFWLGLKAAALARPGVALAQKNSRPGQTIWLWLGPAWLWPGPRLTSEFSNHPKQIQKVFKKSNIKGTSEAAAFWPEAKAKTSLGMQPLVQTLNFVCPHCPAARIPPLLINFGNTGEVSVPRTSSDSRCTVFMTGIKSKSKIVSVRWRKGSMEDERPVVRLTNSVRENDCGAGEIGANYFWYLLVCVYVKAERC
ncbi:hypothetical protein B0H17DRAFT_1124783 [Mycena rosella]|uniref:Uncharacterized protein n=1 Tax=Mycena rosella TaxID=1033263 RepID=A0AAD7MBA0_MYCRO|nr:hypothetical protein B0H17DRAFT_1124783 [Mycena rosella]